MNSDPLAGGVTLGHFDVEEFLGAGGMGRVYRARDRRLNRSIAIKVLSEKLVGDTAHIAQFKREAQAIAAINHPNIGAIHDFAEENGVHYLVLEFVAGDTLAERIRRGAIPLPEALDLSKQITAALGAAHDQGIVHRDLKPENIKITPDNRVKVLDFGIAKIMSSGLPLSAIAETAPTETMERGAVVGTAAYMSPEQARGTFCDKRTDVWAFGCVLYRMLTARPAFGGETTTDVIAAVLTGEPDWTLLPADTPESIRRLLRRCLTKDPQRRLHDIADARLELETAATEPPPIQPVQVDPRRHWPARVLAVVGMAAAMAFGVLYVRQVTDTPVPDPIRFSVSPPEDWNMPAQPGSPLPLISPDGRRLVFVGSQLGVNQLFVRDLAAAEPRPVPGSDSSTSSSVVAWSPDSRFVLLPQGGQLKKLDVSVGGIAQAICDAASVEGGSWGADGTIVFGTESGGIFRVPAAGGTPVAVTQLDTARGETSHRHPQLLPDGRHFVFIARNQSAEGVWDVFLGSLDSPDRRQLFTTESKVLYAEPGSLLFIRDGMLVAQPFDPKSLALAGAPVSLGVRVSFTRLFGRSAFSVSRTGVLAYREVDRPMAELVWVDRRGATVSVVGPAGEYRNAAVSPDGQNVLIDRFEAQTGNRDLWMIDGQRRGLSRYTVNPYDDSDAVWSPDGGSVVFHSNRHIPLLGLYRKRANGEGEETLLVESRSVRFPRDWSPDGRFILYEAAGAKTQFDLWIVPANGGPAVPYLQTAFTERGGRFSPDGRWVLYESTESGASQVHVRRFPDSGARYQISTEGGSGGQWRADGKEIFYLSADKYLMAVPVQAEGANFAARVPQRLFDTQFGIFNWSGGFEKFQVRPDGMQFLLNRPSAGTLPSITVVVNWPSALAR